MHSPVSTQALAHLREASGPSPVRRMSMMPAMTARGSASTPPGPVTGQTSTHLPQRVQASAMAATRADSAVSNVSVIAAGLTRPETPAPGGGLNPRLPKVFVGGGGDRRPEYQAGGGGGRDPPPPPSRSARSNLRGGPSERIVPDRGHDDVVIGRN